MAESSFVEMLPEMQQEVLSHIDISTRFSLMFASWEWYTKLIPEFDELRGILIPSFLFL